jgi:hypothetical protein
MVQEMTTQDAKAFAEIVSRRTTPVARDPWMQALVKLLDRVYELEGESNDRNAERVEQCNSSNLQSAH